MIIDTIKPVGSVVLKHYDGDMNLIEERSFDNLVVTTGKNWMAGRLNDAAPGGQMTKMKVGSSATAAALSDVALGSLLASVSLYAAGGTVTDNSILFVATFGPGVGTGTLYEAGIFNAADTMLSRTTFGLVTKNAADSITISWTINLV